MVSKFVFQGKVETNNGASRTNSRSMSNSSSIGLITPTFTDMKQRQEKPNHDVEMLLQNNENKRVRRLRVCLGITMGLALALVLASLGLTIYYAVMELSKICGDNRKQVSVQVVGSNPNWPYDELDNFGESNPVQQIPKSVEKDHPDIISSHIVVTFPDFSDSIFNANAGDIDDMFKEFADDNADFEAIARRFREQLQQAADKDVKIFPDTTEQKENADSDAKADQKAVQKSPEYDQKFAPGAPQLVDNDQQYPEENTDYYEEDYDEQVEKQPMTTKTWFVDTGVRGVPTVPPAFFERKNN